MTDWEEQEKKKQQKKINNNENNTNKKNNSINYGKSYKRFKVIEGNTFLGRIVP